MSLMIARLQSQINSRAVANPSPFLGHQRTAKAPWIRRFVAMVKRDKG
jgi:hypothetical protein